MYHFHVSIMLWASYLLCHVERHGCITCLLLICINPSKRIQVIQFFLLFSFIKDLQLFCYMLEAFAIVIFYYFGIWIGSKMRKFCMNLIIDKWSRSRSLITIVYSTFWFDIGILCSNLLGHCPYANFLMKIYWF